MPVLQRYSEREGECASVASSIACSPVVLPGHGAQQSLACTEMTLPYWPRGSAISDSDAQHAASGVSSAQTAIPIPSGAAPASPSIAILRYA